MNVKNRLDRMSEIKENYRKFHMETIEPIYFDSKAIYSENDM